MSFLAEVLSEDVDEEADNFVQFESVDVAGKTDFVGDKQLFFLGVTKKSRTNVNTLSILIKCTIDTINNISTNCTRLIVWHCPQQCFLHCHGGNCHHYHSQQWRDISRIVNVNAATNNATGGVAMNPTIDDDNWRSKYNNRRILSKKILTLFLFCCSSSFWGPAWFCHAVAFFLWGGCLFTLKKIQRFGVTMVHAQKQLQIQRSKNKANSHEE
jgi:hypothetical protein